MVYAIVFFEKPENSIIQVISLAIGTNTYFEELIKDAPHRMFVQRFTVTECRKAGGEIT